MYKIRDYRALLDKYGFPILFIIVGIMINLESSKIGHHHLDDLLVKITMVWYVLIALSTIFVLLTIGHVFKGIIINPYELTIDYPTFFSRRLSDFSEVNNASYEPRNNRLILTGKNNPIIIKVYSEVVAQEIMSKIRASKEN